MNRMEWQTVPFWVGVWLLYILIQVALLYQACNGESCTILFLSGGLVSWIAMIRGTERVSNVLLSCWERHCRVSYRDREIVYSDGGAQFRDHTIHRTIRPLHNSAKRWIRRRSGKYDSKFSSSEKHEGRASANDDSSQKKRWTTKDKMVPMSEKQE